SGHLHVLEPEQRRRGRGERVPGVLRGVHPEVDPGGLRPDRLGGAVEGAADHRRERRRHRRPDRRRPARLPGLRGRGVRGAGAADQPLLIVSNRGPCRFSRGADGTITAVRGGGGLVTALSGLAAVRPVTWIASALSDEDAEVAELGPYRDGDLTVRLVVHDR